LKVEANIGKQGFDTDSWNITLNCPFEITNFGVFPLAFSYHYGPLSNLSDYMIQRNHFKIGAAFFF